MSHATSHPHLAHVPLPRSRDQLLTAATVVLALVAAVLALAESYDAGAVVAALCVFTGGWSQLMSTTTTERVETVTATVLGSVLLMACLAFGSGLPTY